MSSSVTLCRLALAPCYAEDRGFESHHPLSSLIYPSSEYDDLGGTRVSATAPAPLAALVGATVERAVAGTAVTRGRRVSLQVRAASARLASSGIAELIGVPSVRAHFKERVHNDGRPRKDNQKRHDYEECGHRPSLRVGI